MDTLRVLQIDHVELFVPDRQEAADWYAAFWVSTSFPASSNGRPIPGGPLMIATTAGGTKLALFEGQPQQARSTAGFHRVAFRVDADAFMAFVRRLEDHHLKDHQGRAVTTDAVVDHDLAVFDLLLRSIRASTGSHHVPSTTPSATVFVECHGEAQWRDYTDELPRTIYLVPAIESVGVSNCSKSSGRTFSNRSWRQE